MAENTQRNYYNDYTKKPMTAAQYSMMRGVTDFTNAEQLNMFEKGHGMIIIIDTPKFINEIAKDNEDVKSLLYNFCNILEYEFKGLSGIEDIEAEDLIYSDGISELAGVGKVTEQSNSTVTMRFTEKSGSTITKFIKFYLNGVRDSRTQTKHYYGLIADGRLAMGFENEIFNLIYLVTDASGLALEAAYLLANAWPNSAKTGELYNVEKGQIESAEIDVTFKCFVLQNEEITKRAVKMLAYINDESKGSFKNAVDGAYSKFNSEAYRLADEQTTLAPDAFRIKWNSQKVAYSKLDTIEADHSATVDKRNTYIATNRGVKDLD